MSALGGGIDMDKKSERPSPPAIPAQKSEGSDVAKPREIGGPKGPEPTRYGDWEQKGRCTDF